MGIDTPDTMMKQYELRLINEMYESVTIPLFATAFSSHLLVVPHISPIRTTTWSDSLTKANLRGHLYLRPKFGVTRFEPVSHEPASCTVPQHQRRTLSLLAHVLNSSIQRIAQSAVPPSPASQPPHIAPPSRALQIACDFTLSHLLILNGVATSLPDNVPPRYVLCQDTALLHVVGPASAGGNK